jgi:hypothetical protein
MTRLPMTISTRFAVALAIGAACNGAQADSLDEAFAAAKPIFDARVRYESVDQEPLTKTADALTARMRVGFQTGKAWNTSLLAEGEFVSAWVDDYNSTTNGKTTYPVVADPKVSELNRFQLVNTSLTGTTITLGRQLINIDDQRFVGAVGWRQNEQTFDALRVVNTPMKNLTIDVTYANGVNRVFGEDSAQGVFDGDIYLANASYQFGIGKVTAFGYLMDLDNSAPNSSSTLGLRFAGSTPAGKAKITYAASYASQKDYGNNPANFSLDYYLAEVGVSISKFSASLGVENLEGDGTKGFATPLATLHKFQGWADKFLGTPANGINDEYVTAGYATKAGPFSNIGLVAAYHKFDSTKGSADLGNEFDVQLSAKIKRVTGILKYADYSAASTTPAAYRDTSKFWAEVDVAW